MIVIDHKTKKFEELLDMTTNSYLITRTKLKKEGINCTQWFTKEDFEKKFTKVVYK